MDIEFHYYITYALARRAKFPLKEARLLAYSSQYTDDNDCYYYVNLPKNEYFISQISQTMNITTPSKKRVAIYPLFHFVPGDPDSPTAEREDGAVHPLNTTPGNVNATELLQGALESKNPYRIGIATHAYADTWAHQNFVGTQDSFNCMGGIMAVVPAIGHAEAAHEPDKVDNEWRDVRLAPKLRDIDNNTRFIDAAENIFRTFCNRPDGPGPDEFSKLWGPLIDDLKKAMRESFLLVWDDNARKKAYGELVGGGIPDYDPKAWRHGAVEKREFELDYFDRYWAMDGFEDSDWYKFQMAVIEHRKLALDLLGPLFEEGGYRLLTSGEPTSRPMGL